jgi:hypothetical protein
LLCLCRLVIGGGKSERSCASCGVGSGHEHLVKPSMRPSARPQHAFLRHHQGIDTTVPAIAAPESEMDQRYVAVARIDKGLQVRVARLEAGAAVERQVPGSRLQRSPGGRKAGWFIRCHGSSSRNAGLTKAAEPPGVGIHFPALLVVQIETRPPEQCIGAAAELRDDLGGTCGRQKPSPTSRLPRCPCPTQDPVEIGRTADRHQGAEFD